IVGRDHRGDVAEGEEGAGVAAGLLQHHRLRAAEGLAAVDGHGGAAGLVDLKHAGGLGAGHLILEVEADLGAAAAATGAATRAHRVGRAGVRRAARAAVAATGAAAGAARAAARAAGARAAGARGAAGAAGLAAGAAGLAAGVAATRAAFLFTTAGVVAAGSRRAAAGRTEEDRHQSEPEVLLHGRTLTSAFERAPSKIVAGEAKFRDPGRFALFRSLVVRSGHF